MAKRIVVTPEQIEEAHRLYLKEGLSMDAIGQMYGHSVYWVSQNLLMGVPRRRPGPRKGSMMTDLALQAKAFYESDPSVTVADTAKHIGTGYRKALNRLHEAKVHMRHSWTRKDIDPSTRCPGPGSVHYLLDDDTPETCPICIFRQRIAPYVR